jgi:membrane protein implicated in regulation of membrane protease activity
MTGGQIAALIVAILLLFPGGCFLFFGFVTANDRVFHQVAYLLLPIAFIILGGAGALFWVAFRRRPLPGPLV